MIQFCIQSLYVHKEIDQMVLTLQNIISGSRSRRPRLDPDYAAHLTLDEEEPPTVVHTFGVRINERFNPKKK
jgi:hypothetical protein